MPVQDRSSFSATRPRVPSLASRLRLAACWLVLLWSVISLLAGVVRNDGWRDHGLFYYGPRMLIRGKNVYDWGEMKRMWASDGRPTGIDPGTTMSGYVMPPAAALLTLAPSLAPPRYGFRAVDVWNLLGLAFSVFFLTRALAIRWSAELRLLVAAFVISLPDVAGVLLLGQTTLVVCACLSLALAVMRSRRAAAVAVGGAATGIALCKFTLALPFLVFYLYTRRFRTAGVALAVFLGANALFALPSGLTRTYHEYRAVMIRENRPGSSYDPVSSNPTYMPDTLVHTKRFLYLALGEQRRVIDLLTAASGLAVVCATAWLFRKVGKSEPPPMVWLILTAAALLLFYHRTYDLAVLMIAVYALVEEGRASRALTSPIWIAMAVVLVAVTHTERLIYGWMPRIAPALATPRALCWTNCLGLSLLFCLGAIYMAMRPGGQTNGDRSI